MSVSLWHWWLCPTRLLSSQDSPGRNIEGRCHGHLQRIFLTQGSSPRLLHCRQTLYHWATGKHKEEYYNRSAQCWDIFLCEILRFHSWKMLQQVLDDYVSVICDITEMVLKYSCTCEDLSWMISATHFHSHRWATAQITWRGVWQRQL